MSNPSSDRSNNYILLTRLADEFAARYRAGERPALQEYLDRYPDLADEIRELFPAMVEIEQVKDDHQEAAEPTAAPPALALQQLGDFRILREIGKGGMGIVYEAEQVSLGRHVALKVLPKALLLDARAKRRFEREAKSAAKLHHTNIVPVFGVGEQDGLPYYIMQFIQGLGLDEVLDELIRTKDGRAQTDGEPCGARPDLSAADLARSLMTGAFEPVRNEDSDPGVAVSGEQTVDQLPASPAEPPPPAPPATGGLSDSSSRSFSAIALPGQSADGRPSKAKKPTYWQSVATLGVQVADALEYAHKQGVLHRDIKPSNLLLDTQGTVWVTDFGLAKVDDQQNLTHTGDILGTLRYMPPEAFEGKSDVRSDVYSLGLTLYEMLAFRPAFAEKERKRLIKQVTQEEPTRLSKLNRHVPRDLETIVHKAIDKDPRQRYATAGALAEDLQRFLEDEPIRARRVSLAERSWRWCKRNPAVAGLTAAVFVLLAAVSVVASAGYVQTRWALGREATERGRAETNLYHSLVGEAQAIRRLRDDGYRGKVWDRLKQALALETPDKDPAQIRQEAVACLGDFVGLAPTLWEDFPSMIIAMEVHPDARQIALGLKDGTLLLRDQATGAKIELPREHGTAVFSLSFAADGRRLASADFDGLVNVWQANPDGGWACMWKESIGRPNFFFAAGLGPPVLLALSSDGNSLVTYSSPQPKVTLWNLADRARTTTFELPGPGGLNCLALSPDGKLLAAGFRAKAGHRLLVWETAGQTLTHNLASDLQAIFDVAFSGTGNDLAYGGTEGCTVLAGPKFQPVNRLTRFGPARFLRLSPDHKLVAFADAGLIHLWEIATNREVAVFRAQDSSIIRFSKDGQSLVGVGASASHYGGKVRIWNLAAAREKLVVRAHVGGAPSVAFSPNGQLLASAGKDRTVRIWDPATGRLVRELPGFRGEVESVAFSPDGSFLATGDGAGDIRFWHVPSWQERAPLEYTLGTQIRVCAFSPDGRFFAAGGEGGIMIWKIGTRRTEGGLDSRPVLPPIAKLPDRMIANLRFSPDGNLLAWVSQYNAPLHVWDVSSSRSYPFPPLLVWYYPLSVAFSQDSRHLAFISHARVPEVWDVVTRQKVYPSGPDDVREARERQLSAVVALSPDDAWLAASTYFGAITVWDLQKGQLLLALPEERSEVESLAWSPNRELLAASYSDGSLALWNVPQIRAQLAELGLDWQDAPLPAPRPKPAPGGPPAVEAARLFSLDQYDTARATLTTEGNICRVDVTAVDGTSEHVKLNQEFDNLQKGASYTVRFRARADTPRSIVLDSGISGPDWHDIGLRNQIVPLTEVEQAYQYEFQAKDPAALNAIYFILGERTGTVWIADFTLTRGTK